MPNYSNLSYHQKLDFLTQWLRDCGPGHKKSYAETVAKLKNFGEFHDEIQHFIDNFGHSRPPTLFQCRLKLMQEWFTEWSSEQRHQFFQSLNAADSDLVDIVENLQLDDLHNQLLEEFSPGQPRINGHSDLEATQAVLTSVLTAAAVRTENPVVEEEFRPPIPIVSPPRPVADRPESPSGDEEIL